MAICPKCGKEIKYLRYFEQSVKSFYFQLTVDYRPFYERDDDNNVAGGDGNFECPECMETIFHDEDDAVKFLKGEVEQKTADESHDKNGWKKL